MREVIRRFENEVGYDEIVKFDNDYVATLHSDFYRVSSWCEYKYKQDAIETFQFNHYWLVAQEKIYNKTR